MAVSKTQKGKRKVTSKKTAKQSVTSGFQTEIILLIILAASIILMISNFGMGGIVGDAISRFSFGAIGLMAYAFPFMLFISAAFLLSNKHNPLAYKKALAAIVFFIFMCGFVQLITEGYMKSTTLLDYYAISSDYHTGGGLIGGLSTALKAVSEGRIRVVGAEPDILPRYSESLAAGERVTIPQRHSLADALA